MSRRRSLLAIGNALAALAVAGRAAISTLSMAWLGSAVAQVGMTPLVAAADRGDVGALRQLLADSRADLEARDARGRTALLAATQGNHIEVARELVRRGANVNAKDQIQDSPYLLAGARGHVEILRLTLDAGADLSSVNRYGGTALIPAAHHGHVDAVRLLLTTKIAVDHVNRLGWTALLEAIILGDGGPAHQEIVRLLLAAGADPSKPDGSGVAPLAHAEQRGQAAIVALLRQAIARRR